MTSPVKYFHDGLPGAPVLSGSTGALLAVLQACLVDGWGTVSLTSVSVSAGVATATVAAGHPFEADTVAFIAGAGTPALNGEKTVSSVGVNTFAFPAPGVADGVISGAITAKVAPAGWTRVYAGTNKAVYKSSAVDATGCLLRVDDAAARYAVWRGFESMTDVDTGSGPFPSLVQAATGLYVPKSDAASAGARKWMVVADDRYVLVLTAYHSSGIDDYACHAWGDFSSWRNPDAWNCVIVAATSDVSGSNNAGLSASPSMAMPFTAEGTFVARPYGQVGGSSPLTRSVCMAALGSSSLGNSGGSSFGAGPSPVDAVYYVLPILLMAATSAPHGVLPGVYFVPAYLGSTLDSKSKLAAPVGLAGRKLVAFRVGGYNSASSSGRMFVDITGPWR